MKRIFFIFNILLIVIMWSRSGERCIELFYDDKEANAQETCSLTFFTPGDENFLEYKGEKIANGMRFVIDDRVKEHELCAMGWNGIDSEIQVLAFQKNIDGISSGLIRMNDLYSFINFGEDCSYDMIGEKIIIRPQADSFGIQLNTAFVSEVSEYHIGKQLIILRNIIVIILADSLYVILTWLIRKNKDKILSIFRKIILIISNKIELIKIVIEEINTYKILIILIYGILFAVMFTNSVKSASDNNVFFKVDTQIYNRDIEPKRIELNDNEVIINIPDEALKVVALNLFFLFEKNSVSGEQLEVILYKDGIKIDTNIINVDELIEQQAVIINFETYDLDAIYSFKLNMEEDLNIDVQFEGNNEGNITYGISYEQYDWGIIFLFVFVFIYIIFAGIIFIKSVKSSIGQALAVIQAILIPLLMVEVMMGNLSVDWKFITVNLIISIFILSFIMTIVKNCKVSLFVYTIFFFLYSSVSYFVLQIRGIPFLPQDIKSIGVASSVMKNYSVFIDFYYLLGILLFMGNLLIVGEGIRKIRIQRKISGALFIFLAFFLGSGALLDISKLMVNAWNQSQGFKQYGHLASFYANIISNRIVKPNQYSPNEMRDVLNKYNSNEEQYIEDKINVIVVMNEAFSDLSFISDFETNEEVMPYFDSLENNAMRGNLYVSILGGNTCNTEFEFLTGHTLAFFPPNSVVFQNYIEEPMGSIARVFQKNGYKTMALHPYYGGGWKRSIVYPRLGIEDFHDIASFNEDVELVRSYVSDKSNYEKILELIQEEESPLFLFNVTMQNHGGYNLNYKTFRNGIRLTESDGVYPETEQYLSLIHISDNALKEFVEGIQKLKEKTIICFFGDHQPFIENDFIEELYGKNEEEWNLGEKQKRYCVPYAIIANYDMDFDMFPRDISANYLGIKLLKAVGAGIDGYYGFLNELSELYPVVNANGYMDSSGKWYSWGEEKEELLLYEKLQYGIMFDHVSEDVSIEVGGGEQ